MTSRITLEAKRRSSIRSDKGLARGCHGSLMLEMVVATMLFTVVGTGVLVGVSTTHISGARTKGQSMAENIGRNQMEYVFSLPYQAPPYAYPSVATPAGLSVAALAEEYVPGDTNIERVVVTIRQGEKTVLVLETLRASN